MSIEEEEHPIKGMENIFNKFTQENTLQEKKYTIQL